MLLSVNGANLCFCQIDCALFRFTQPRRKTWCERISNLFATEVFSIDSVSHTSAPVRLAAICDRFIERDKRQFFYYDCMGLPVVLEAIY